MNKKDYGEKVKIMRDYSTAIFEAYKRTESNGGRSDVEGFYSGIPASPTQGMYPADDSRV